MHHSSVSWEITRLHFSSRNFILFCQKDPVKVPNFRLLISANLYFDMLHLLKVYKISAKNLQRSYVSWHWRRTQNLKKSLVSKMTRIWWILIGALKSPKNLHFDWSLLCNYITFDLKRYRGVRWKIWRKIDLSFGKWCKNFHQNTWVCQKWYFHGILLSKVENAWAKNL